jgi:mRNA-degrading endonuclease RelE of RelBE toxin-antitoxin system
MRKLRFTARAGRDIEALPARAKEQIRGALRVLVDDPHGGISLKGPWEGYRRFRSGDYRIIYKISVDEVVIYYIRHRREAYRG